MDDLSRFVSLARHGGNEWQGHFAALDFIRLRDILSPTCVNSRKWTVELVWKKEGA